MNEIGSEFSAVKINNSTGIILPSDVNDYAFVFSGRTALETVLKNEPNVRKAMLPSYCCDSMIEPFRRCGIEVCFFEVNYYSKFQIDLEIPTDVDFLLWCNYFGFVYKMPDVEAFIKRGGIVVEDITHSFYSSQQYNKQSTYLIASLRKWEPLLCGGYCGAVKKNLKYKPVLLPPNSFLDKKLKSMSLKEQFLKDGDISKKPLFLTLFNESNSWLAENYSGFTIDNFSKDFLNNTDSISNREKRIKNAKYLYEELNNLSNIHFLFDLKSMDCPFFVPLAIQNGQRDKIRKKLIDNNIFCPVHWPKPNANCNSNMYDIELSLICDQRYDEKDMKRIASVLLETEQFYA